jgi:hypothetical protein
VAQAKEEHAAAQIQLLKADCATELEDLTRQLQVAKAGLAEHDAQHGMKDAELPIAAKIQQVEIQMEQVQRDSNKQISKIKGKRPNLTAQVTL